MGGEEGEVCGGGDPQEGGRIGVKSTVKIDIDLDKVPASLCAGGGLGWGGRRGKCAGGGSSGRGEDWGEVHSEDRH